MSENPSPLVSPLILAYGTLRAGVSAVNEWQLPTLTTVISQVALPGQLFDAGSYPAARLDHESLLAGPLAWRDGPNLIIADLMRITDSDAAAALTTLDAYEDIYDGSPIEEYQRVQVALADVGVEPIDGHTVAWCYNWIAPVAGLVRVPSGRWAPG